MLFQEEKFGLFVHFGVYAVGGFHEQEQWRRNVPPETYAQYLRAFAPKPGCTDIWAKAARDAGMQYLCLTAKHHDGFCLWDTQTTDYSVMHTPCARDLVAETAESCRKYGLRFAIYYSLPDWHCPYAVQGGDHALPKQNPGDTPSWTRYKEYLRAQIRELLTGYGKVDALFWDIPAPAEQYDPAINAYVRSLQPGILINDRGFSEGDYKTPERTVPIEPFSGLTEACQSVGASSWGYRAHEDYFSHAFLIRSIDRILQKSGNYLLNVGSTARAKRFSTRTFSTIPLSLKFQPPSRATAGPSTSISPATAAASFCHGSPSCPRRSPFSTTGRTRTPRWNIPRSSSTATTRTAPSTHRPRSTFTVSPSTGSPPRFSSCVCGSTRPWTTYFPYKFHRKDIPPCYCPLPPWRDSRTRRFAGSAMPADARNPPPR